MVIAIATVIVIATVMVMVTVIVTATVTRMIMVIMVKAAVVKAAVVKAEAAKEVVVKAVAAKEVAAKEVKEVVVVGTTATLRNNSQKLLMRHSWNPQQNRRNLYLRLQPQFPVTAPLANHAKTTIRA